MVPLMGYKGKWLNSTAAPATVYGNEIRLSHWETEKAED